jgi:beta-hydroxylase
MRRVVDIIKDPKRLKKIPEAINILFEKAEAAGKLPKVDGFLYDYYDDYPGLKELEDHFEAVQRECRALLKHHDQLPNVEALVGKYTKGSIHAAKWKSFMFKSGELLKENCALAPNTAALIKKIPGCYTAFFSILEPHQYIYPHWGYWKGYVRYHLGVVIPNNNEDEECWLRVNSDPALVGQRDMGPIDRGVKHYWKEGEGVIFDDTFLHDAKNDSDEIRVVLWLDLRRKMPLGLGLLNRALLDFTYKFVPSVTGIRQNAAVKLSTT